jgi:hypothetical protein
MSKPSIVIGGVNVCVSAGSGTVVGVASGSDVIVSSSAFFPSLAASLRVANISQCAFDSQPIASTIIPRNVEFFCSSAFTNCQSISFKNDSRLKRIESEAFGDSPLKLITIPRNVAILCSSCFSHCQSISSISFENDSRLKRTDQKYSRFLLSNQSQFLEMLVLLMVPRFQMFLSFRSKLKQHIPFSLFIHHSFLIHHVQN